MRYPGDEFETEEDFRHWEAEAEKRRTDPVYAMRRLDERFERERDLIVASGAVRVFRDEDFASLEESMLADQELAAELAGWDGRPYSPGDPYLLDRIESHRAPDGGFHRDY